LNETNGIVIDRILINGSLLYYGPIERMFVEEDSAVSYWNYDKQVVDSLIHWNVENYDAPPGLSQTSRITNDDEVEDNFFDSMLDDDIFAIIDGIPLKHELDTNHTKNPYGYLKQYFTEKIDIFEVNCTMEELINVKKSSRLLPILKERKFTITYPPIQQNTII